MYDETPWERDQREAEERRTHGGKTIGEEDRGSAWVALMAGVMALFLWGGFVAFIFYLVFFR